MSSRANRGSRRRKSGITNLVPYYFIERQQVAHGHNKGESLFSRGTNLRLLTLPEMPTFFVRLDILTDLKVCWTLSSNWATRWVLAGDDDFEKCALQFSGVRAGGAAKRGIWQNRFPEDLPVKRGGASAQDPAKLFERGVSAESGAGTLTLPSLPNALPAGTRPEVP